MSFLPMLDTENSSTRDKIVSIIASNPGLNTKQINNFLKKQYATNVTYQAVHKTLKQMKQEDIILVKNKGYYINNEWIKQIKLFAEKVENIDKNKVSLSNFEISKLNSEGDSITLKFKTLSQLDNFLIEFENSWAKDLANKNQVVVWQQWHNRFAIMYPQQKFKSMQDFEKMNISHYILCKGDTPLDNWSVKFYQEKNIFVRNGMECSESCETGIYGDLIVELFYSDDIIEKIEDTYNEIKNIEELNLNKLFSDILDKEGDFYIHIQKNEVIASQIKRRILIQYLKEFDEVIEDLKEQKKKGSSLKFKSEYLYLTERQISTFLKTQISHFESRKTENEIIQKEILNQYKPYFDHNPINIYDFGTGDGKKAESFIEFLKSVFPLTHIHYYAIDFSSKIIDMAISQIRETHLDINIVQVKTNILKLADNPILKKNLKSPSINVVLCLGNLYSNLEENQINELLSKNLHKDDIVFIGVQIRKDDNQDIKRLIQLYSSKSDKEFISTALEEIGIGSEYLEHQVEYNPLTHKIEVYLNIKKIPFNLIKKVRDIGFKEGDRILMISSWKPTVKELENQLSNQFQTKIFLDKENTLAVAFCIKK